MVDNAEWDARPRAWAISAVRPLVHALERLHPTRVQGAENIPRGAALLVGNHGVLGYESPFFFEGLFRESGRVPVGLADRWFFRVPVLRDAIVRLGSAYGSAANGLRALRRGELVVCYPGGAREVFKSKEQKYRCLWERSVGFVRLAIAAGVPIVPFAAAGVDDTFDVLGRVRGSGDFLMGDRKYDLPLVWGSGPMLPRRVPFWFRFGAPIMPPKNVRSVDREAVLETHAKVWSHAQGMVDGLVQEWGQAA